MAADRPCREVGRVVTLLVAACALRLWGRIDYDEDVDAMRFALAVVDFDPTSLRPHAPFYPVYIAAAKVVNALGASPRAALAITGAITGAIGVGATAWLAREVAGARAATWAGALALASPFLWLSSQKLSSDMPGTACAIVALALCARARRNEVSSREREMLRGAACVLAGVLLGVRLSLFPITIAIVAVVVVSEGGGRAWARRARDAGAGVLAWLVPLVAIEGASSLVRVGWVQGLGHFTRWGGSVVTTTAPAGRALGIAWGLWANGFGGPWNDTPAPRWIAGAFVAALAIAALRGPVRASMRAQPELWVAGAAYFAWAALGQASADKPRHLLPLVPLGIVGLACGAERLVERIGGAGAVVAISLVGAWFADGVRLVTSHLDPSPAAAIVGHLATSPDPRIVVTRDLARMISEGAPSRRVLNARSDVEVERAISDSGSEGVLVTSEALRGLHAGLVERGARIETVLARPRSRYVDSLWFELSLVSVRPPE